MSLIDRVKNILKEAPERTPDNPSGLDFEGQSKKFVKNERDKKKTMRKLEPKGSKQGELNLGNTNTTNTPLSTKRTLKGRPLGSKTKSKGETYKQLTTGGERQKQRKTIKKEFEKQQPISDLKKAKKYAAGEYPKIGGGDRMTPKSKGPGASTGGTNIPPATVGGKSKGTTPVKVNITKPVKQSEVSKKAKEFTAKVNKANVKVQKNFVGRKAQRIKDATGGKKTGSLRKGNLSFPGDRSGAYQATKSDIEARKGFKGAKTQTGAGKTKTITGLKADEKNPFVKTSVRKGRASDLGGNIFDTPKVTDKDFKKSLKDVGKEGSKLRKARAQAFKDVQTDPEFKGQLAGSKPTFDKKSPKFVKPEDPFKGATGKATTPSKSKGIKLTTPKDIKLPASFGDFEKKLKTYKADVAKTSSKTPKKITKLTGVYGPAGAPQKGTIVKTTPVKKPVSGTYSISGGERTITDRKKRVEKIIGDSKKRKDTTLDQDKLNQAQTGKDAKGNILDKETRKKLFQQSRGKTSGGGSGGGKKPPLIGTGGTGGFGGGGKKTSFTKAAFKSKASKFGGKLKNFAKANPLATALAVGAVGYYGYQGIKRAIDGPQLDPRKDFTKTGKIQFGTGSTKDDRDNKKVGDPVRFTYGRKETKNRAKPFLTPDTKNADGSTTQGSLSKFKKNIYTVKDSSGKTIDVNKRIQNSAFTKQLRDASTSKKQSAKDFIKKYKKAAEYRGITT